MLRSLRMEILTPLKRSYSWLKVFFFVAVISAGFLNNANAQSCNGAVLGPVGGGVSIPVGGSGDICANNAALPAKLQIDANNVDDNNDRTNVQFVIDWNDGTAPQTINPSATDYKGGHVYQIVTNHFFPATGAGVKCSYKPTVSLIVAGTTCAAFNPATPNFIRWNTEKENSGILRVSETATDVTTYKVCAGSSTVVTFTDRTTLNCVPPALTSTINNLGRKRQFIYGTTNTITGTVLVNAAPQTYPFAGAIATTSTPSTVKPTPVLSLPITIPNTAVVGQVFEITLNYNNACNPVVPVTTTAQILVVAQPTPPTSAPVIVCNGNTPAQFSLSGVPAGKTVNWYKNVTAAVPAVQGTVGALISSGTSTTLPIATAFPGFTNTAADNYIVWGTYLDAGSGPVCESIPVAVTRSIREKLDLTGKTITPSVATACPGDAGLTFALNMPAAPNTQPVGGATKYTWTVPTNWTITAGQGSNQITVTVGAASAFGSQTVSVVWEYTSTAACDLAPLVGGAVNVLQPPNISANPGNKTICQDGSTTFSVTASGAGLTYQWQVDQGSGFANVSGGAYAGAGSATLSVDVTGTGVTFNGYKYRVVVTGTCNPAATSPSATLTVQAKPSIVTSPTTSVICVNGATSFVVVAAGQGPLTYQWQVDTGSGFNNISNGGPYSGVALATLNVNTAGTGTTMSGYKYQVVVSGACAPSVTSGQASLTIQGPTPVITTASPAGNCVGTNLALAATETFFNGSFGSRKWTGTYLGVPLTPAQMTALLTSTTSLTPTFNSAGLGVNKTGQYILTLTTTDNNGCPNSASITINVGQVTAAILYDFNSAASPYGQTNLNATVCSGTNLFIDGNPTGGAGVYISHVWTFTSKPAGAVGALTPASSTTTSKTTFNFTTNGTYVLQYAVSDNGGCTFTTAPAGNLTINVISNPAAAPQTPAAICSDAAGGTTATVDLTALNSSVNAGGGLTFTWYSNAALTTAIATPTAAVVTSGVPVYVKVSAGSCFNSTTATYTVNSRPAAPTSGTGSTYCSTGSPLAITVPAPGAGLTIDWYAAATGGTVLAGGTGTASFVPPSNGTYYAQTRNTTTGCVSTSRFGVVSVKDVPTTPANAGPTQSICATSTVLAATAADNGGSGLWTVVPANPAVTFVDATVFNTTVNGLPQNAPGGAAIVTTLRWTVKTAQNVCPSTSKDVAITVNALPTSVDPAPHLCEDVVGGGTHLIADMNVYNSAVTSGTTVTWFKDIGHTQPLTTSPAGPITINNTTQKVVYFHAVTPATCIVNGQITFTVDPSPVANPQALSFCEDVVGGNQKTGINLTSSNAAITGGAASRQVDWFSDALLTTPIVAGAAAGQDQNYTITATKTVYAKVTNTASTVTPKCFNVAAVTLTLKSRPANNPIVGNAAVCVDPTLFGVYQVDPTKNPGSTYTWTATGTSGGVQLFGGGGTNSANFFALYKFPVAETVTITEQETINGCTGALNSYVVTVATAPGAITINGPLTVCTSSTGIVYTVPAANATSLYTWTVSGAAVVGPSSGTGLSSVTVDFGVVTPVTISVKETSTSGCAGSPASIVVNLAPKPTMTSSTTAQVCSGHGNAPALVFTSTIASTYSWKVTSITGGVTGTTVGNTGTGNLGTTFTGAASLVNTSGFVGSVAFDVTPTAIASPNCVGTTQSVTLTVNPEPVLVVGQGKAICSNSPANYEILLTPVNLPSGTTFTWIKPVMSDGSNQGTATTAPVAAGTAGTIHITDVLVNTSNIDITAKYTINPTSGLGCIGTSQIVTITIHPQPVGANASASAICSDGTLAYNLQTQNINTLGNGVVSNFSWIAASNSNIGGESTSAQAGGIINDVLSNVTGSDQTVIYTVTPTSAAPNSCSGNTFTVSVLVHPKPVGVTASAPGICSDASVGYNLQTQNINVVGNSVPSTFSWIATSNGSVGGESTSVQAGNIITDVLSNVTNADQTVVYTVTPTSTTNLCLGGQFTISVVVHPKPVGANAIATSICSDAPVAYNLQVQNINALGNGVVSTFSWIAVSNTNVGGESLTTQTTGTINDVLSNVSSGDQTVVYNVTPSSGANNCIGTMFTVSVTVHPKPVGANTSAPAICSDAAVSYNLQTQNINTLGNSVTSSFTWKAASNSNVGGESTTSQSNGVITDVLTNVTGSDQTVIYTVIPTNSSNGCVGASFTVSVLVHPKPVGVNDNAVAICSDGTVGYDLQVTNITALGNGVSSSFSWIATANGNVGGESSTAQAGGVINDALVNITNTDQTIIYTVTPKSVANGCSGTPFTVSVVVHPKPVGANVAAAPICSDAAMSYNLQIQNINTLGNAVASTFVWVATANPDVTGESTSNQSTAIINDVLTNVTNTDKTVVYTVTPTSSVNSCIGSPFTVSVLVHPKPVGVNASAPAICSDAVVNYNLQTQNVNTLGNSVNSNFSWIAASNTNVGGESTGSQAGNIITDALTNVTSIDQTVVYTVTPISVANTCTGANFTISVVVHPKPVGVNANAAAICSDATVSYNLQTQNINTVGNSVASNFSWVAAPNGNVSGLSVAPVATSVITDALTNVTNADQTVVYTVTPTSSANGCLGATFTVSVVVHPKPVGANASAPDICSNTAVGYDLQVKNINAVGNAVNSKFTWQAASNTDVGGESTTLQTTSTINDILTNVTNSDKTVVYTVAPTSVANNCLGASFTVSVLVHPQPVGADDTAPAICSKDAVGYNLQTQNVNTLGNGVAANFTWVATSNSNVSGESLGSTPGPILTDILVNVTNADQTVIYTVTAASGSNSCIGSVFKVSVVVHPEPVGVNASAPAICSDAQVNYNLQTTNINTLGNNLASTFSWIAASNSNVGGESLTPQAGNLLTDALVNVTNLDQTVVYTVTPSNAANPSCNGATFTISVVVHAKPVGALASATPICSDDAVGYDLQAQNINTLGNGVSSSFSWIADSNGLVSGESLTTQTGSVLTDHLTNVTTADQVVKYTITPKNGVFNCLGTPFVVNVTVHPKPVGINASAPAICSSNSVNYDIQSQNINTLGNGINSTFSWVAASNPNVGGESTTAQTGSLIGDILTNITNVDQTVIYTVLPSSVSDNCTGAPAFTVSVVIHPEPVGVTASAPPICSDDQVNYDLQLQNVNTLGNNLSSTFSWVATANANVSGESTTPQAGSLITDALGNVSGLDQTVFYTVTPTGAVDLCVGNSFTISILVHPKPVGVTVSGPSQPAICSDVSVNYDIQVQNINALGNGVASTFTWKAASNGSVSGESTGTQTSAVINDVLVNITNADQTVVYTIVPTSGSSCVGASFNVSVTVHPKPVGVSTTAPAICSHDVAGVNYDLQNSNINILGNGLASTFSWAAISNANVSGESTIAQSSGIINDVLTNVTNADQLVIYNVTPTGTDLCPGTPFTVKVTVKPEPVGINAPVLICSGDLLTYNFQSQNIDPLGNALAGTTFTWMATADNPNVTGESLTLQSTNAITDVLKNITTNSEVVNYIVNPTGPNGCPGNPFTISITVRPQPVLQVTPAPACSGQATNLILATDPSSGPVQNYKINSTVIDGGLVALPGNAAPTLSPQAANYLSNDKFTNFGTGVPALKVTYNVTPISTSGCAGDPVNVVVVILPEPVVATTLDNEVCSAQPYNKTLITNGSSVAASSFDITAIADAGLIGTPTTGLGLLPGALLADAFVNKMSVPLKVTYTVTPHGTDGCVGSPRTITLTVDPEPVLFNPGFPATCSSNATNSNPVNVVLGTNGTSVNAATYKLTNEQYSTGGPFSTTLPANFVPFGLGNAPVNGTPGDINLVKNDMFSNTSTGPVTVRYTIIATAPGANACPSAPLNYDIVINPEPNMIPGTAATCSGDITSITLSAAPGSAAITSFFLQSVFISDPALTPFGTNAGLGASGSATFLFNDKFTNTSDHVIHVKYTIIPQAGSCNGAPQVLDLSVNPAPGISGSLNKTVCSTDISGITLAVETSPSSTAAANYNILNVNVSGGLVQTAGSPAPVNGVASNYIRNDKFTNPTNGPLTVTYTVQGVSALGCKGTPKAIVLTVEPTVIAVATSTKPDICSRDFTNITLSSPTTPTSGTITFSYTAVSSIGGLISGFTPSVSNAPPSVISDTLINNSPNPATVTYNITAIASGARGGLGCNSSPPVVVVITVEPKPKMTASPLVQTLCEGIPTSILLKTTTVPTSGTVQFKFAKPPVITGGMTLTSPPKTTYLNGESITDVWSNPDVVQHTVTYSLIPFVSGGPGCQGDTTVVTVNVNPLPSVVASVQPPICSNEFVTITLTSDVDNTVNKWVASVTAGTVTGAANGSGDLIFQTLRNTGTIPATVHYHVTPKANGCDGTPIDIDVIVNPIPTIDPIPASTTICYGATFTQALTSPVAGVTFSWTVDPFPNAMGVPGTGSGPVISQVITNPGGSQDYLTYTVIATGPGATACASNPKVFNVVADPEIKVAFLNTDPTYICLGQKDFLTIQIDGQAPFQLVYSRNDTLQPVITNAGNVVSVPIQPKVDAIYKIVSLKNVSCVYSGAMPTVTYKVGSTDATFSLVGPVAGCQIFQTTMKYNQKAGVRYTWSFGDGSPDSIYIAATDVANMIIHHDYSNPSSSGTLTPKIVLRTDYATNYPGCAKTHTESVTIYPTVITNVYPDKSTICSGEQVTFTNQSFGVSGTGNKWFYRQQGTTQVLDIRTTPNVNYVLNNTTTLNPVIIEVVYQATNGNCPAPDVVIPITVYRAATPSFDFGGTVPLVHHYLIGGHAPVTFTNTSVPISPDFQYDWNFGLDANPATATGVGPYTVDYTSQGIKSVTLTVTNIASPACTSTSTQSVYIELMPLIAAYKAEPLEFCFPGNIKVTENTSTGDQMQWKLYDNNGALVLVSTELLPTFYITNPGTYILEFRTSDSVTGLFKDAPAQKFTVYDKPFAAFQVLPPVVFVPNTELSTINNSAGATGYFWDFDDQGKTSTEIAPKYTYQIEGHYTITLVAQNDHGGGVVCTDTARQVILAKQGGVSKIPNAFTPSLNGPTNGTSASGSNYDVFLPSIKGVEEYNLQIYDRWGNLLFESNSILVGWDGYRDGKLLPAGVYVYKITLRLSDGQRTTQIGDVTMIR